MKGYEIVLKGYGDNRYGYFIVDEIGIVNGPYDTVEKAKQDVPQGQLQYPLPLEGE